MLTIALTGGIGSGKSAVTDLFQKFALQSSFNNKLVIIDADVIAKSLLTGSLNDSQCSMALREVQKFFGPTLFDAEGYLNRDELRSLIFSSKEKKQQLESLLHPLVYEEISNQLSVIHSGIVIVAIPLFFETIGETRKNNQSQIIFDRILVIDVPIELQIERSRIRDNCSPELIKKIINAQVERKVRLDHADDIINNSGTNSELQLKVKSLLNTYCSLEKLF